MNSPQPQALVINRDSVCAADDLDDHCARIPISQNGTLAQVLDAIQTSGYLPQISGDRATWIVELDRPLAVVAQQWATPEFLVAPQFDLADFARRNPDQPLFFRYWCQADPIAVFDCLKNGSSLPDKYGGT